MSVPTQNAGGSISKPEEAETSESDLPILQIVQTGRPPRSPVAPATSEIVITGPNITALSTMTSTNNTSVTTFGSSTLPSSESQSTTSSNSVAAAETAPGGIPSTTRIAATSENTSGTGGSITKTDSASITTESTGGGASSSASPISALSNQTTRISTGLLVAIVVAAVAIISAVAAIMARYAQKRKKRTKKIGENRQTARSQRRLVARPSTYSGEYMAESEHDEREQERERNRDGGGGGGEGGERSSGLQSGINGGTAGFQKTSESGIGTEITRTRDLNLIDGVVLGRRMSEGSRGEASSGEASGGERSVDGETRPPSFELADSSRRVLVPVPSPNLLTVPISEVGQTGNTQRPVAIVIRDNSHVVAVASIPDILNIAGSSAVLSSSHSPGGMTKLKPKSSSPTTTTATTSTLSSNTNAATAITTAAVATADSGFRVPIPPVETQTTELINNSNGPNSASAEEGSAAIASGDAITTSRPAGAVFGVQGAPREKTTTVTLPPTPSTTTTLASSISSTVNVLVSTDSAPAVNALAYASSSSLSSLPPVSPYVAGVGAVAAVFLVVAAFLAVRRLRDRARTRTQQHMPVTSTRHRRRMFTSHASLAVESSGSASSSTSTQQRVSRKTKKLADTFKTVSRDTHLVHQIRAGLLNHSESADYMADDEVNLNSRGQSSIASVSTTPSTPIQSRSALLFAVSADSGPAYWPFFDAPLSRQMRESPVPDTLPQIQHSSNTVDHVSGDGSDSENDLLPRKLSFELFGGSTVKAVSSSNHYTNRLSHLISVSSSDHAITATNMAANILQQYNVEEDFAAQVAVAVPMPEYGGTQSIVKTLSSSQFLVQIDAVTAETRSLRGDILD
ncbi:hypothetical protein HK100_006131 [Physocladia obscura]|uniref:Uncharacterized protein n=1 Tax=Physocladia obscura TaxID=109957 RepID=A0AAD5SSB2_9FUNG|nr:hypothetical protein HK100_006131 [Physocladia obscura]